MTEQNRETTAPAVARSDVKTAPTETMRREIARYGDERLAKELAFAEGFSGDGDDMPAAVTWLYLLRIEAKARADA